MISGGIYLRTLTLSYCAAPSASFVHQRLEGHESAIQSINQHWLPREKGKQALPGPRRFKDVWYLTSLSFGSIEAREIRLHAPVKFSQVLPLLIKQTLLHHHGIWFGRTAHMGFPPVVEAEQPVFCCRRVIMVLSQPLYNRTDHLASYLRRKCADHAIPLILTDVVFLSACQCSQLLLYLLFEPG